MGSRALTKEERLQQAEQVAVRERRVACALEEEDTATGESGRRPHVCRLSLCLEDALESRTDDHGQGEQEGLHRRW